VGTILSLAEWIRDSGQWTAAERGRLQTLTEHFPGGGDLEVVFGATDDGAPWCAVMNGEGEVLVHVARLASKFIVHVAGEEVVSRGDNLRDALGRWLRPEPERQGVVVPFARLQSGVDMMILVAVAALLEEALRHHQAQGMEGAAWPIADTPIAEAKPPTKHLAPIDAETASHAPAHGSGVDDPGRSVAPIVAALAPAPTDRDDPSPSVSHPAVTAAAAPVQVVQVSPAGGQAIHENIHLDEQAALLVQIRGGDGDDVLIGGAEAEHLVGGDGDDVLIGGGGADILDGGAGDDWIVLASEALASGGRGADTFVISAPKVMDHADTLLGTILDYSAREGDRLVTAKGEVVAVPPSDGAVDTPPDARGQKVEVDLDGNGHVDGYVFIAPQGHSAPADPAPVEHGFDPCLVAPSESWSGWTDIIG
jgi:hypothetical protein